MSIKTANIGTADNQVMTPTELMELAIAEAHNSQTPYGAVIVKDGKVVAQAGNRVKPDDDPTAHAEVSAIRTLMQQLQAGPSLEAGYTLYTTCEPCPMCAATCVWAGISEIVYGVGNDDFSEENPNLIELRCQELIARSPKPIKVTGGLLKGQCKQLHEEYPL